MDIRDRMVKIIYSKALELQNEEVSRTIQKVKPYIRKIPRIPSVINRKKQYSTFRILTETEGDLLILVDEGSTMDSMFKIVEVKVELNYDYFTYSEVLKEVLPKDTPVPASFEIVGSIVHLNLNEEQINCKDIIGRVIHDKTGKTVITKIGQISNEYRSFDLEIIGGDGSLETTHKEGDILFYIDYRNVYWCSKLQNERHSLLKKFKKEEVICDLFCGVGSVSLAALNMGCKVYSNDLNPHAIKCLKKSIILNKLNPDDIKIFNLSAEEFLRSIADAKVDHFFLNLPEYSLNYLKAISTWKEEFLVHCYFFCRSDEEVVEYIFRSIGLRVSTCMLRVIRKVSPSKDMYKLEMSGTALKKGFK